MQRIHNENHNYYIDTQVKDDKLPFFKTGIL